MADKNSREEFAKKHPNITAREMPNSYEAESALLGGMLIDRRVAESYLPRLEKEDFYTPAHRCLYEALNDLFVGGQAIDLVTTVQQLESAGTLELSGGVGYVSNLVNAVPSVANSEYYFNIVKKHARLRTLISVAQTMADEAYALDPDDTALTRAEAALYALAETGRRAKPTLIAGYVEEALNDIRKRSESREAYRGVPTGFTYLDMMLGGGFQKSDLIILAARPGQGKTSFAMNCAVNAALSRRPDNKEPYSVAVFSLEMSAVQLARRILCSVGDFSMTLANRAAVDKRGWSRLFGAQDKLASTKLYVDESGNITPAEILSKCRALKHSDGLDFIMIDYLQLMQSGKRIDNIVREIGEMTRALKLAAKELDVPILLLSQMSRGIEQRKDPKPQLSDLRDSGAIEQDADIVLFLERKEDGTEGGGSQGGKPTAIEQTVYLNVAKHRNGETGSVKLTWLPSTVTFKSEPAPEPPKNSSGNMYGGRTPDEHYGGSDEPAPLPYDPRNDEYDNGLDEDDV